MPATGKVYIYNTTNQPVKVELNDTDLEGRIPANSGRENGYLPVSHADAVVDRSDATSTPDAVFATNNTLEIKFSGTSNKYPTVTISPGSYSTDTDLVLYIFYNYIVLISPTNNALVLNSAPATS